jgi:2-aminoethylphosphonate-pyruvate transaminase
MNRRKLLFTPGPLSTSTTVKQAMMCDMGSRDHEFVDTVAAIRNELLSLAGVSKNEGYEAVLIQGSGTFGVESVISSVPGRNDKLLILSNGAYGERILKMAVVHDIPHHVLRFSEDAIVDVRTVDELLRRETGITHVACIHSETTTGLFNPVAGIGEICRNHGKVFIVDAMSSFGGVEMEMKEMEIDFLVSSSNKCIEGVPGFSFVVCKKNELEKSKGRARSLSLDLYEQWAGLEASGQFRFTPPTLSIMAFRQALVELQEEGGVVARERRYRSNKKILDQGMEKLGFVQYLRPEIQGHIISSFLYPADPRFDFNVFYEKLNARGFIIYPGKLGKTDAFRIGNIGQIFNNDVHELIEAIADVLKEEGIVMDLRSSERLAAR